MKVEVEKYSATWPDKFLSEKAALKEVLRGIAVNIHHIGSTAVPDLPAKPIIDILIEVSTLSSLDHRIPGLKALGYESLGEFGIARRRYFRKGCVKRTHQIHAFEVADPHVRRHIAFRDYLAAHPSVARAYAKLKMQLARTFSDDIESYCSGKDQFVKTHERLALQWFDTQPGAAVDRCSASLHSGN